MIIMEHDLLAKARSVIMEFTPNIDLSKTEVITFYETRPESLKVQSPNANAYGAFPCLYHCPVSIHQSQEVGDMSKNDFLSLGLALGLGFSRVRKQSFQHGSFAENELESHSF